jgi:transglutaminase-like putative cysteine protease
MDKAAKKTFNFPFGLFGRRKAETLQEKIDAAQRKQAQARAEATLEPVTVSPAAGMTKPYTALGLALRTLTLFMGVFGLNLFLCDALKIVILNDAKAEDITLSAGFIALWSAIVTLFVMAVSLHKISRILAPFLAVGGIAAYMFTAYSDPVKYVTEAFRCTKDLVFSNLAAAGYTTYMQYISEEPFTNDKLRLELVKFIIAALIVVSGLLLGLFMAKRVYAWGVAFICAIYLIPVFTFNITRSNKGLACVLVFICGAVALYLFDCIYGGVFAARKAKREKKKAAKLAKKEAKRAKKEAKRTLDNTAAAAYNEQITAGAPRAAAKKVRAAVYARARKEQQEAKAAAKRAKLAEKTAKAEAKKAEKEAKAAAKRAAKEQKKMLRARSVALKKSKKPNEEEAAAITALKSSMRAEAKAARAKKNEGNVASLKTRAASGFAGAMAMLVAFLAIWIPLAAVKKNFPIINFINNRMQLVRTYVTAYLMGDDVDLNSLAMYGGVAELNPRNVDFNTPQYTGQRLFVTEASYAAPVYMRSWIGSDYDLETDYWTSADADEVIAYRERFGSAYTPDNITYFFAKYVYPNALDVNKVDQYRNLDSFGFRVFQVHVVRRSGTSRIIFVPSILNAGLGIMERGSLDKISKKYSAYYDGIYSSRFFDENTSYSVSSFNPVMKHPDLAVNLENSIWYYNRAKVYAETIDAIQNQIAGTMLFKEDKEYSYDTPLGTIQLTGTDLTFLVDRFEQECADRGYNYKYQTKLVDELDENGNPQISATGEVRQKEVPMNLIEVYLHMTSGERKTFMNAFDKELDYRDYAESTYRTTFGSDAIAALADQILAEAGIVKGEKYEHDKSYLETKNENQIKRMTNLEKYGNVTDSWFTDAATGETIPRHQAIMAVLNYLRENYTYTLDPEVEQEPVLDENGVQVLDEEGNPVTQDHVEEDSNLEAFLFEVKQGYCVHFATSAVALLRELGFAVRYDEGYIANSWNRTYDPEAVSTYRSSVRDYDAHSWVEVYYPSMGWVMYETTPSFMEEMYDANTESSSSGSSGIDSSKITVRTPEETEPTEEIVLGSDDDIDYTVIIATVGTILAVVVVLALIWTVLKVRAGRASYKRQKLVEDATSEQKYQAGETDIHASARAITDCIFDIFAGLGCPPQTGELPTEYAVRINGDYADISKHRITDVMDIIEKEEFGGTVSFRELGTLAEYLKEIQGSVYAALPFLEKIRMRYIMNVV